MTAYYIIRPSKSVAVADHTGSWTEGHTNLPHPLSQADQSRTRPFREPRRSHLPESIIDFRVTGSHRQSPAVAASHRESPRVASGWYKQQCGTQKRSSLPLSAEHDACRRSEEQSRSVRRAVLSWSQRAWAVRYVLPWPQRAAPAREGGGRIFNRLPIMRNGDPVTGDPNRTGNHTEGRTEKQTPDFRRVINPAWNIR